jgi:hypothetical protein
LALGNVFLLLAEAALYFAAMATLFRLRRQFGLGVFVCALGSLHFLETYRAHKRNRFPIRPGQAIGAENRLGRAPAT